MIALMLVRNHIPRVEAPRRVPVATESLAKL
jgi:hypothetical protein